MNVVDSSGWIEYLTDGRQAAAFARPIRETGTLLVPTVCIFEVFKFALRHRGRNDALEVAAHMRRAVLVPLDETLALLAAEISVGQRLPFADSILLATAWSHRAALWTMDAHFSGLSGVRYFAKQ